MTRMTALLMASALSWAAADSCQPSPDDADGDGWTAADGDCDDQDPAVNPAAEEVCDAADRDEDCDGLANEDDPSVADALVLFADSDGDGYGDPASAALSCVPVAGAVSNGQDCDDADPAAGPQRPAACAGSGVVILSPDGGDGAGYGYDSVQDALDALGDGDTLYLEPGAYQVNLDFPPRGITLTGTLASRVVLDGSQCVDGDSRCSVVRFDWPEGGQRPTPRAALRDVTLEGGQGTGGAELGQSPGRTYGGGVAVSHANPILDGVAMVGNAAALGGGLYLYDANIRGSALTLVGNTADSGGGAYVSFSQPTVDGLRATGNTAGHGGALLIDNSNGAFSDLTIEGNSADYGGGLNLSLASPRFDGLTVVDNVARQLGGGFYIYDSVSVMSEVVVRGNRARSGGGINISAASPRFSGLTLEENSALEYGGGLYAFLSFSAFEGADIRANSADVGGGAFISEGRPTFEGVSVVGNTSTSSGGGVYASASLATFTNAVVSGNESDTRGGGIYESYSPLALTNVTIAGNRAAEGGGMFMHFESAPQLESTILAFNDASEAGPNLFVHQSSEPTVQYCLLWDAASGDAGLEGEAPGAGRVVADPRFVDDPSDGDASDDDYHLAPASPARDAGSPAPGQADPDGSRNDMGAYGGPGGAW